MQPRHLTRLVDAGVLRHPIRNVYVRADLPDCLPLRIQMLRLVVPEDCVVTDRSAAWLWGARTALAPGDHLRPPRVSVFAPPGRRLRNDLTASGERVLAERDLSQLQGLLVTTPLRTACDLGRLLHQGHALAAVDALTALGAFDLDQLVREVGRFRRYRGVVQLRVVASLADPKAGSPSESVLRWEWIGAGLPRPMCQVPVPSPKGGFYYLDMGLPEDGFAAEYDGEEWHGEDQEEHDEERRDWIRTAYDYRIEVVRNSTLYGPRRDVSERLRGAWNDHLWTKRR